MSKFLQFAVHSFQGGNWEDLPLLPPPAEAGVCIEGKPAEAG
jgi:hypothetical protein